MATTHCANTETLGELRERVTVLQKANTPDSQGGRATTPATTLATVWAAVRALSAGEGLQTDAVRSLVQYEVEIRNRTDITATMHLTWTPFGASAAKTLQILGVRRKDGRDDRLLLSCVEVA